jgi:hypothetical protein
MIPHNAQHVSRQYASRAQGLREVFMFVLKDNPGDRILDEQDERGINLDVDRLRRALLKTPHELRSHQRVILVLLG